MSDIQELWNKVLDHNLNHRGELSYFLRPRQSVAFEVQLYQYRDGKLDNKPMWEHLSHRAWEYINEVIPETAGLRMLYV